MNEGHEPRCSDKLFTSFFNTVLPVLFIEPVRCPLRMAWEEKCHSCQWEREESKLESQRKKHKTFDKC